MSPHFLTSKAGGECCFACPADSWWEQHRTGAWHVLSPCLAAWTAAFPLCSFCSHHAAVTRNALCWCHWGAWCPPPPSGLMGFQGLARLRSQAFCRPSRFPLGLVCTSLSPWARDPGLGAAPALTWPPHRASTPSTVHTTTTTPADPRARCSCHLASTHLAPLALQPAPSPAQLPFLCSGPERLRPGTPP